MRQQELFAAGAVSDNPGSPIPGFALELDYISPAEEQELMTHIDSERWEHEWRRRRQQYGLGYSSGSGRSPVWLRDFPAWLCPLADRVSRQAFGRPAENCVINEYIPPQGIGPHRDYAAFGPVVACVSLGSDIVMDFTLPERRLFVPVYVPRGSFWTIQGEARWKWQHGIAPRLTDTIEGEKRLRSRRISITFRTGKGKAEGERLK